jgi:hypothetical protein
LHQQETAFTNAVVGDTKIIEIVPITDHSLTIVPVATGLTNILLLDDVGNQVGNVGIAVVADEPAAPTEPLTALGPGRVRIHNKALLTSYTAYRCSPYGCQYFDELPAKEPAALPPTTSIIEHRGYVPPGGGGETIIRRSAPGP